MLPKKLIFRYFCYFLILFFSFALFAFEEDLQKIKKYKVKILQQIQKNQKEVENISSLIQQLAKNSAVSEKQFYTSQEKSAVLVKKISKEEKKLKNLTSQLQETLNNVYQKFLNFYLLDKIQQHSIIPSLEYFQNYKRNQQIMEILLNEDIQLGHELQQQVTNRDQQLVIWNNNQQEIQQELAKLAFYKEKFQFDKEQYTVFLGQLKKQQTEDQVILLDIEKNLTIAKKTATNFKINSFTNNVTKNFSAPANGKLLEVFGIQNPKIPFYHKNGVLIKTAIRAKVKSVVTGQVVFLDNVLRYNTLIIIDHGKGVFSTYGRLVNTSVKNGDQVQAKQIIGEVASYDGQIGLLYFAIRENGKSVDPTKR